MHSHRPAMAASDRRHPCRSRHTRHPRARPREVSTVSNVAPSTGLTEFGVFAGMAQLRGTPMLSKVKSVNSAVSAVALPLARVAGRAIALGGIVEQRETPPAPAPSAWLDSAASSRTCSRRGETIRPRFRRRRAPSPYRRARYQDRRGPARHTPQRRPAMSAVSFAVGPPPRPHLGWPISNGVRNGCCAWGVERRGAAIPKEAAHRSIGERKRRREGCVRQ